MKKCTSRVVVCDGWIGTTSVWTKVKPSTGFSTTTRSVATAMLVSWTNYPVVATVVVAVMMTEMESHKLQNLMKCKFKLCQQQQQQQLTCFTKHHYHRCSSLSTQTMTRSNTLTFKNTFDYAVWFCCLLSCCCCCCFHHKHIKLDFRQQPPSACTCVNLQNKWIK
jgi:hypothetical protein